MTKKARSKLKILLPLLAASLLLFVPGALAVHDLGLFQLDRNATATETGHGPGEDWATLSGGGGSALDFTGIINDVGTASTGNQFTGGGSKDNNDITSWLWKAGEPLDKDDITNAYAAAYSYQGADTTCTAPVKCPKHGDLIVYYGLDRLANNGSAQVGFWFLQDPTIGLTNTASNGGFLFSGVHENHDVLVQSNFSQGGVISSITVYEWLNGALSQLASAADCVGPPTLAGGDLACATVNQATTTAPWSYTAKFPDPAHPNDFPSGSFFEGGIDITQLVPNAGCFSKFVGETRTSTPFDARLKDFALGNFKLCGAKIAISPNATNEVGTNHELTVRVQKKDASNGFTFGNASGITVTGSLTNSGGATAAFVGGNTCTTVANGTCTLTINSPTAGTTTVSASAGVALAGDGTANVTTDGTGGSSGPATKHWVDAAVSISPNGVNEVGTAHTFNITVTALPDDTGTPSFGTITPSVSPVPTSQSSTCDTPTVSGNTATCTLTINNSSAGVFTANVSALVTMGGVTVTRSTSGNSGPGGSGPAIKRYVDAAISISPNGVNEVGTAHTFTITVTAFPAGTGTPSFGTITPSVSPAPDSQSSTCDSPTISGDTATCTLTINSNSAGTFTADASASVTMGGVLVTRSTSGNSGPGGSGAAVKKYVDAAVSISPNATNGITEPHTFNITVTAIPGSTGTPSFGTITPSVSPAPTSQSSTCGTPTVSGNSATCTLTINSNSAGTFTANVSAQVTMGGVPVTRSTSGNSGPGGSGPATKTYVAGSLRWVKKDDAGNLLGGATFQVCATDGTAAGTGHTPLCVSVLDNSAPDADPVAGQFLLNAYQSFGGSALGGLALGTYTIQETTPPSGYTGDSFVQTITLTQSNLNATATHVWVNTKPGQGCTPGFWQGGLGVTLWNTVNDPDWKSHGGAGTNPFTTGQLFDSFFTAYSGAQGTTSGKTMLDFVGTGGGPNPAEKAARAVVAAYLNAAFGLSFPYTTAQISAMWTDAVAKNTADAFNNVFNLLAAADQLGCPIS